MAAIDFDVSIDERSEERVRYALRKIPKGAERALVVAINTTIRGTRSDVVKAMARETGQAQIVYRKGIALQAANFKNLQARLRAHSGRLPLIMHKARQTKKGVTYKVGPGQRQLARGAFIARMPSGHRGVFQRSRHPAKRKRPNWSALPIFERFGPNAVTLLKVRGIEGRIRTKARDRLPKETDKQVRRILAGYTKR